MFRFNFICFGILLLYCELMIYAGLDFDGFYKGWAVVIGVILILLLLLKIKKKGYYNK